MKNRMNVLFVFLFVFMMFALRASSCKAGPVQFSVFSQSNLENVLTSEETRRDAGNASLPRNLEFIGEGAFEGTAFAEVTVPEKVTVIEKRAFADIPLLFDVHIPESAKMIGEDAFDGDDNLILKGFFGSYVQEWVRGKGIRFILLEGIRQRKQARSVVYLYDNRIRKLTLTSIWRTVSVNETKEQNTGRL